MLTAYKVYLDDGSSYVTSMAQDVTLEMAQDYFAGECYTEEYDGKEITRQAVKVEKVR